MGRMKAWLASFWRGFRSALGNAATSVIALATLTWFLWHEPQWQAHPDALAALVASLIAMAVSFTPTKISKPSKHDVALLAQFRALVSEDEKMFLRDHDLADSFSWKSLKGCQDLADRWIGAEYEFDNREVQAKLADIVKLAKEFISELAVGSVIFDAVTRRATTIPAIEKDREMSARTWQAIKAHNNRATILLAKLDEFVKFARKTLA